MWVWSSIFTRILIDLRNGVIPEIPPLPPPPGASGFAARPGGYAAAAKWDSHSKSDYS